MVKATILIVDDEEAIRSGLKNLIHWEKAGFQIIGEAENGRTALTKIRQLQPDIVITDLIMPELDGLELTRIIHQQFPKIHFLVLSSYDEFSYVSRSFKNGAVDYLLKPAMTPENLLTALRRVADTLAETPETVSQRDFLSQSLNRSLAGYELQELPEIQSQLKYPHYFLLYTNLHWYQDRSQLLQMLATVTLKEYSCEVLPFTVNNAAAGLLIAAKQPASPVKQHLAEALSSLKQVEAAAFFVLSAPFPLAELTASFATVKKASDEQQFFFKQQLVVTTAELFPLNDGERFDTKKFLRAIVNNDFLLGIARIRDHFNEMILSSVRPSFLKQQASSIFYTLLSSLEENFPDDPTYSHIKDHFLKQLGCCLYLEDFSKLLLTTIGDLTQQLQDSGKFQNDELLNNILRFIHDNYAANLSLTQLAETFHFSYNYLSSFLSMQLDMSFSDYLKKVRMEKAQELLLHSDLNLSEISEAIGYADLSYFSKIFKKAFGTSPSKYRKENRL